MLDQFWTTYPDESKGGERELERGTDRTPKNSRLASLAAAQRGLEDFFRSDGTRGRLAKSVQEDTRAEVIYRGDVVSRSELAGLRPREALPFSRGKARA